MTETEAYIASTILHDGPQGLVASSNGGPGSHFGKPGQAAAATIGQSVVCVTAELAAMNREDTSNTEFGWRTSEGMGSPEARFKGYMDSISRIGWVPTDTEHRKVDLSSFTAVTLVDFVKQVVHSSSGFSSEQQEIMKRALDSLVKEKDRRELFNAFVREGKNIVFALTAAGVKDGVLTLRTVEFGCKSEEVITDCLLFRFNLFQAAAFEISLTIFDFVANQGLLDAGRKRIEEHICASTGVWVRDIPLD
ncbi:hypothetical protein BD779DRAFT_276899 [Infundibulicybe gibba]|nr:hypothetical protein BD779DRAFT_276899 [Infundibulicybe gibba]